MCTVRLEVHRPTAVCRKSAAGYCTILPSLRGKKTMFTAWSRSTHCSLQKERRELLQGKAARGGFGAAGQPRLGWLVV